ncbi:FAR1-related sequence 5-like protein [Tanacetum coccineum]
MKEIYGGFENIGATDVECKNHRHGLNDFIGNRDAQMVVDKLLSREEFFEDFLVKYKRDEDTKELVGLFWADAQAKRNYDAFGDVMSFDATFRSNKYNMVLVPFTGIDNHNRRVIFAAALLARESAIRYTWLLNKFKKVFIKLPKVVVTDQDPAMKIAIEEILPNTRHRLCMWHIMAKLTKKWNEIMEDFKLTEHKWLLDMFELRSNWIPAYFRHEPMSGLMRTTSRSEERFKYGKNTHDSKYTTPDFKTQLQVEKEAVELYTHSLFYDVQDEIYASLFHYCSLNVQEVDTSFNYVIRDTDADYKLKGVSVEVKYERRWSKNALPSKIVGMPMDVASSSNPVECVNGVLREIYGKVKDSVTRLVTDIQKLHIYKEELALSRVFRSAFTDTKFNNKIPSNNYNILCLCNYHYP